MPDPCFDPARNSTDPASDVLPDRFENALAQSWPPGQWRDVTVLIATSGGPDSTALACAMTRLKQGGAGRLFLAHYNHRLRHATAEADARFVRGLAEQLGVGFRHGAAIEPPASEAKAREARYRFLADAAAQVGARFVVTGHTADDQAETILHRILRGTGISGLAGMRRTRPLGHAVLIRPLLDVRRAEVLSYLDRLSQPFCDDETNRLLHYTRNRIRHDLLPRLASDYNPQIVDALLRLGQLAGETHEAVQSLVLTLYDQAVHEVEPHTVRINIASLEQQPTHMVRELFVAIWQRQCWPLQSMGYEQWDRLAQFAQQAAPDKSKCVLPGAVVVERRGACLELRRGR